MELSSLQLVDVLRATLHPDHRLNAEKQLELVWWYFLSVTFINGKWLHNWKKKIIADIHLVFQ